MFLATCYFLFCGFLVKIWYPQYKNTIVAVVLKIISNYMRWFMRITFFIPHWIFLYNDDEKTLRREKKRVDYKSTWRILTLFCMILFFSDKLLSCFFLQKKIYVCTYPPKTPPTLSLRPSFKLSRIPSRNESMLAHNFTCISFSFFLNKIFQTRFFKLTRYLKNII